jgi:hypothetical protein
LKQLNQHPGIDPIWPEGISQPGLFKVHCQITEIYYELQGYDEKTAEIYHTIHMHLRHSINKRVILVNGDSPGE